MNIEQLRADNDKLLKANQVLARDNARLAAALKEILDAGKGHTFTGKQAIAAALGSSSALRDLLAPTVEVLRQATLRPITWQDDVKAELARLRAVLK